MDEENRKEKEYPAGGVFDCLCDDCFTFTNSPDPLFEFMGYSREEMEQIFHNHLLECIFIDDRPAIKEEISKQLSMGNVFMYEYRLTTKDREIRWIWVSAEFKADGSGLPYFHCIFHDITHSKSDLEKLAISEQRYKIILEQMQDIIFELDCGTFDIYYSANFKKKFGYQIPVKGFPDSMFSTDIIHEADKAQLRLKFQSLLRGENHISQEYRIRHRDGRYIWVDVHATVMRDKAGNPIKILGIITDIHKRKMEILETRKIANLDPLTGLLNRRECIRRIGSYTETCNNPAALIIVDIDNFKTLNDTKGHPYGDMVLSRISQGLFSIFRQDDVVARIGGDEFMIFLPGLKDCSNVTSKLEAIQSIFINPNISDLDSPVSCSIGAAFYPEHGGDFTTLFAKADTAMYHAKNHGKGQYCIYREGELISQPPLKRQTVRMQNDIQNQIIEYIFRIFMKTPDNQTAIPSVLEFIGHTFRVDRIYICQKADNSDLKVSYNWCKGETQAMTSSLDRLCSLDFHVSPKLPAAGFRDTADISDPEIRRWFKNRGVKAAFLFWVGEKNRLLNIIGLEDCHEARDTIKEVLDSLYMVCEILNLYLIKEYNLA